MRDARRLQPITPWHLIGGAVIIAGVAGALGSPSGRRFASSEQDAVPQADASG